MAKTANELLQGILTTVVKIEQKMSQDDKKTGGVVGGVKGMMNMAGNLLVFGKIKDKTKKSFISFMKDISDIVKKDKGKNFDYFANGIIKISSALPDLVKSLQELGKINNRRVDAALGTLGKLYNFMYEMGDGRHAKRVEKAATLFGKIGKSLQDIAKPLKTISMSFIYLALGIVAFAGAMLLTSALLGLSSPKDALMFLGFTIVVLVLMFGILAASKRIVDKGARTLTDMGLGMAALALGILSFALTIRLLPIILGGESAGSIIKSMVLMVGIVGAAVLMFVMIGAAASFIQRGVGVVFMMGLGMVVLSVAMVAMATAAKYLQGGALTLGDQKIADEEKDSNKKMVLRGLGTFGLIFLAAAAAFALLGIPVVAEFVLMGVATAIAMSIALVVMAKSVSSLVKTSKELAGEDIATTLSTLISGTLNGFLLGISPLSGGKTGVRGVAEFMKNSAKIFAAVSVLVSMSIALSMFAFALSAFAELETMRPITGTDKNGKPIFGEKINVVQVGKNMTMTLSTFLTELISSTDGLTKTHGAALRKLGRALTGRRGILSGLNDFAEVLKTFSQFGPAGEIGFIDMVPDGTDEDGNAKFKQVASKVKISVIAKNIANSFGTFVDELVNHSSMFEITGPKGRSMMRLAEILMGGKALKVFGLQFGSDKPGLLEPITKFSEILTQYASFGDGKKIPIIDPETGKVTKVVDVADIAKNIINTLGQFSKEMGNATVLADTKKAQDNIGKFSDLMESTSKITAAVDGMTKLSTSVKDLAEGIGALAINLDKLNTEKLERILDKTSSASSRMAVVKTVESTGGFSGGGGSSTTQTVVAGGAASKPENWDQISQMIGDQVGARVSAALRNGQFVFEFDTSKTGGVYYWQPK
jgi:hypothetical protein